MNHSLYSCPFKLPLHSNHIHFDLCIHFFFCSDYFSFELYFWTQKKWTENWNWKTVSESEWLFLHWWNSRCKQMIRGFDRSAYLVRWLWLLLLAVLYFCFVCCFCTVCVGDMTTLLHSYQWNSDSAAMMTTNTHAHNLFRWQLMSYVFTVHCVFNAFVAFLCSVHAVHITAVQQSIVH